MTDAKLDAITERLEQLIRLVAFQITSEANSKAEKIRLLGQLGVENSNIAKICETTPNAVSARLLEVKKPKKAKKAKK